LAPPPGQMSSSLLDEIAGTAPIRGPTSAMATKTEIVRHLQSLCTTRRGAMVVAPRYGIDDVTLHFHEMPGGMEEIRLQLEETIRRYEPRLTNARVAHLPGAANDLVLRFEIRATAVFEGRLLPVRFTAAIDGTSRAVVD
jgi:type VI secretion system lysozyme-like protein